MFITTERSGYDRNGEQFARGLILLLVQDEAAPIGEHDTVRAIVRHTVLKQFGPWMMGRVQIRGAILTVTGSYGNSGLPMDVPSHVYEAAIPLPKELYDAWSRGGGHNSAGDESSQMRSWALANLNRLYTAHRRKNARLACDYDYAF